MKTRDSRPRTPNRLCVQLECRTVGGSTLLTPSASRSLFCGFCFTGLSSGLPGINHRILIKVTAPGAPGICLRGKLRMQSAVCFPEPGGPSTWYGANGRFSGNQMLNTKAVNAAALEEGRGRPPMGWPAASLRRQSTRRSSDPAVALRREENTRSELWSVWGPRILIY